MNTKRTGVEENEMLGRCLSALPKRDRPTVHPSSDLLLDFTNGTLSAESQKHVKLHLLECRMCSKSAVLLGKWNAAEAGARGVVVDITRFFRSGGTKAGGPGEAGLTALAAATLEAALPAWELHEEGGLKVGVTEGGDGVIVVSVERAGVPATGVGVTLEIVDAAGAATWLAEDTTDESGESKLGLVADFQPARPGCRYRIKINAKNEDQV